MYVLYNYILNGITLSMEEAETGYHSGDCSDDIERLKKQPHIRKQLDEINPESLRNELKEFGAWTEEELSDHEDNLSRILWDACAKIVDGDFYED